MAGFLQRHGWVLPLAFGLLLAVVGWTSYRALETRMKAELADGLVAILDVKLAALEVWADENRAVADVHAADPRVRDAVAALLAAARRDDARSGLLASPAAAALRGQLGPVAERHGYLGFAVLDLGGLYLGGRRDDLVGTRPAETRSLVERTGAGQTVLTQPLRLAGAGPADEAYILLAAPVRDAEERPVAVLGFAIDPVHGFKRLLASARPGESGETYAFDASGRLLSASRFDDQLREIGLLPPDPAVRSFLNVEIRDPGGNLLEGFEPALPLPARPLTRAAADAVVGGRGVDVGGYRDYRGVSVAGAWAWLPKLGIGLASEIDADEAYQGLAVLRVRFGAVVVLLLLGALAMFLYSYVVMYLRRQVDEAREVGRYRIERKLGAGGMGTVYLASHALLRRPTAIKILNTERAGSEGAARFEREVQVSSSLTHPNTIEIYDFGYTPEGTFYYAMEYLEGFTLRECVEVDGPLPEARVLHLMRQACGSIAEAHAAGLMHRDLKPSNVMLCERGGLSDFVKVLDFGLVRSEQQSQDTALTAADSLTGTPLYMPPEAVQAPGSSDLRGDVYQLGLITWFLLVGRPPFRGESTYDVLAHQVGTPAEPPSKALGQPVSADLERIVLWCLEKSPDDRPSDAGVLLAELEQCASADRWSQADAAEWWGRWRGRVRRDEAPPAEPSGSTPSGYSVDFGRRLPRR